MAIKSGQVIVATAGTAVQLPDATATGGARGNYFVSALCSNTGCVYIGNDGADDVTSANGFPLLAGQGVQLNVSEMACFYVDADVDGEGIAWLVPHDKC